MNCIGIGYDIHRLQDGLPLILGGVPIPHTKGFVAHSNGDALCHAITDALLGALALGDIGSHFPDTDPRYKGADSVVLLQQVAELVRANGYRIANIDTNVIGKAATGIYPESELSGLTPERAALFERVGDGTIRIPAAARELVAFKPLNLIAGSWPMRGPFDAIFCRNVAIYFDHDTQGMIWRRLSNLLVDDGALYIGHSERVSGSALKVLRTDGVTSYRKKGGARQ